MEDDVFCGACGVKLPPKAARPQRPPAAARQTPAVQKAPAAELPAEALTSARKHVTVLFADISGFTAMSEKLDPEEVTDLMNGCLSRLADVVVKYEGYVDKFVGDCIMALFGAPIAHENDPELAVRAALEMLQVTAEYNKTLPIKLEKPLSLHIGINSGMVVVGGVGSDQKMNYTAMGDTVNLASRLESIAGDGQIFISKYTHNLIRNKFEFKAHEPIKVKGKKDPVPIFEVTGVKSALEQKTELRIKTPLIGRSYEMMTLQTRIDRLFEGEYQVVLLTSDAGIGKSRIQREIETYLVDKQVQILHGTCHSFSRATSYYVFSEMVKSLMGIDSEDLADTMQDKLVSTLPVITGQDPNALSAEAREAIVFLGCILGLDSGDEYDIPIRQMDAQDVKMSIFRSIRWLFEALAAKTPMILILEDLHYADPISIEVLNYLFESIRNARIMLLLLLRPEKDHPSANLSLIAQRYLGESATEIVFHRLKPSESDELVRGLLQRKEVPGQVLAMIRERADGNPFYIEALVRDLIENRVIEVEGDQPVRVVKNVDQVAIPDTIQGMIVSRIDRLPGKLKEILQAASVIGPVFKLELLNQVVYDPNLEECLQQLAAQDMIFESRSFPEIEYSFKNILIQEAAYSCLLLKRQRELHKTVAQAIEKIYKDRLEDHYEVLAIHCYQAQDYPRAYDYYVKSGLKAKGIFANQNAINHFTQALSLRDHVDRPDPSAAEIFIWLSELYELTGDLDMAIDARQKAIDELDDELMRADSQRNIGRILEKQGKKEEALAVYEEVHIVLNGYPDSIEMARLLMNESWVLNRMRRTEEAIERCTDALSLFEAHQSTEDIAQAHNNLAVFYETERDLDLALEHNLKSMALFSDLNHKRKLGNVYLSLGYVYDKRGERDTALEYFEKAINTMDKIGNRYGAGTALMAKGRCYMDMGQLDEAESVLLRSLHIHQDLRLNLKIIANELALARVHLGKNKFQEARSYLADARDLARADDNQSDLGKVTHLEALILAREGQDATGKFEEAIKIFQLLGRERDAARVREDYETYTAAVQA